MLVLLALLAICLMLSRMTSGAMSHLPFFSSRKPLAAAPASLVDLQPWQTAQTLAAMAVTAEENEYARQAEHLADHEVDQAFAAALRQTSLDVQHRTLTGQALALKHKIAQLEQMQKQDQAVVDKLSGATGPRSHPPAAPGSNALQLAKAQLGLDNDEIADAERDLERASGDDTGRIQQELAAHEESMRKFESQQANGQIAMISVARNRTLAARIAAWFDQLQRYDLLQQAQQRAIEDARTLTAQHNAIEAAVDAASAAASDATSQLASLRDRTTEREILSIDDDRIQTEQQLASVYAKWTAQVEAQHEIMLHLILNSLALILFILAAMAACDAAVRRLMERPSVDQRQMRTLRNILELGIQILGAALVLMVIFGPPQQTSTILGLATAALTIALQDYIVAFLGWFTLIGKNGIHVGDWAEINGVCGEVVEFRLMTTTLLETGGLDKEGHPTGRRTTLMNSYAIRGTWFTLSTAGQWLWDEITASMPANLDVFALARRVEEVVLEETRDNMQLAEREWGNGKGTHRLRDRSVAPIVFLRPSTSPIDLGSGIELHVRFVTSATERFETRKRLYRQIVELLQEFGAGTKSEPSERDEIFNLTRRQESI